MQKLHDQKWPLHALLLLTMAFLFSIPYRLSLVIQPVWLAYLILTALLVITFGAFLIPPRTAGSVREYPWPIGMLILCAAALPRIYWMYKYPVDAVYGDMLPLIRMAGEKFLNGEFPYTGYALPWPLPLTFFPGLWMSYLPAVASGVDLRWIGWLCTLGCVFLMLKTLRHRSDLGVIGVFALLPVFTFFTVNGHTQPYWLMLCGFGFCFSRGMTLRAAACLGLAMASRQTALVLFPFAALGWWRLLGFRGALKPIGLCAVIVAVFCVPFFLRDADAFLLEPLRHYQELALAYRQGAGDSSHLTDTFGFANLAFATGTSGFLSWARSGFWISGVLGCLYFAKTPAAHLRWMAVTALVFTLFTPIPWLYAYFPFWLLAYFGRGEDGDYLTSSPGVIFQTLKDPC